MRVNYKAYYYFFRIFFTKFRITLLLNKICFIAYQLLANLTLLIEQYLTNSNVIQSLYLIRTRDYSKVLTININYYLELIETSIEEFVIILSKLASKREEYYYNSRLDRFCSLNFCSLSFKYTINSI